MASFLNVRYARSVTSFRNQPMLWLMDIVQSEAPSHAVHARKTDGYRPMDTIQWIAITSTGPSHIGGQGTKKTFCLQFVLQNPKLLFFQSLLRQLTERHENRKLQNKLLFC